jgi:MSHA biogenesis protein MshM
MRAAGYRGPNVFAPEAVRRIVKASEGLTRRVNIVADKSLLAAFADNQHGITARHVDRAVRDSEFGQPRKGKARIGIAAAGVAAGLGLGLGLHFLLSPPATPPAAQAAPASGPVTGANAAPLAQAPAPAAGAQAAPPVQAAAGGHESSAATPAADAPTVAATVTTVATGAPPASADASTTQAVAQDAVPPPPSSGKLLQARFAATQAWLRDAPGDRYSIQLYTAGTRDLHSVEELLGRAAADKLELSDFYVYGVKINDQQHYRLAYGLYAGATEANQALRRLPPAYRQFGPYLRSVERMRSQNRQ